MKPRYVMSKYNFFFPLSDEERVLGFNSLARSLIVISPSSQRRLQHLTRRTEPFELDGELSVLVSQGFIIPETFDELAKIREQSRRNRDSASSLNLTIVPTLSCNFRCGYCFEEHPVSFMSQETQAALISFVERRASELETLGVTWFGGEPLLAVKTIVHLSRAFTQLAAEHDFHFKPASLITNGWGLSVRNCELLEESNIGNIQITLDGVGEIHDQRRPLSNGQGTFTRLVDNISNVLNILGDSKLTVRVNLEEANQNALQDVYDYLNTRGLTDRVGVSPGQLRPYTGCSKITTPLNRQQFYELRSKHDRQCAQNGKAPELPSLLALGYCCAQKRNAYIISPTGALFKCWTEIGLDETRAVGHLQAREVDRTPEQRKSAAIYEDWDFLQDEECAACKVAPICGGGCTWAGMMNTGGFTRPAKVCSPYKFGNNLERAVKLKYEATLPNLDRSSVQDRTLQSTEVVR